MSLMEQKQKYERWWLHKRVRRQHSSGDFRLVERVEIFGPPSGFNAVVVLHYEDGSEDTIGPPVRGGYRPNKTAVEVES